MHDLFEKLESPALTDIEVDFPTEVNAELALGTISDLYAGETITAVYKVNVLPDNLIISGNGINGVFSKNITINSSNNTKGLDVLWGRRKIDRLKDIYNNQFKEKSRDLVKQDIVTLALQHHLVSDFTSLVAVDITPTRPESEQLKVGKMLITSRLPSTQGCLESHPCLALVQTLVEQLNVPPHTPGRDQPT